MIHAQSFTELTLGTLPFAQLALARDGGQQIPLIQLLSAILGQKGEQVGFFRYVTQKTATSGPQLTGTYSLLIPGMDRSAFILGFVP